MLSPIWDSHRFLTYGALFCSALVSPTFHHATLFLSETFVDPKKLRLQCTLAYLLSAPLLGASYFFSIFTQTFVLLLALSYAFWILRLLRIIRQPHLELDRIQAKHLLKGQLSGWILPGIVALAFFIGGFRPGLGLISPFFCLFPLALLMGLIPSQKWQKDTYIVQTEKRSTFSNLIAGLAHELNNPMTFIHSNMEPIRESVGELKKLFPQPDEKVDKIFSKLGRMLGNVENGVTRARSLIETFRQLPNQNADPKQEINLPELLDETIELLGHRWGDQLRIEKQYETIPKIRGHRTELIQVFTNLLTNACDAVGAEGRITVSTKRGAGGVKVVVSDTGEGIPVEDLGRIFDPFYTTKEQGKGTGLGLSISLQLVMNNKGSIEVKSRRGEGTDFIVFFPA
jgi:signal transduction histidine kinase